MRQDKNQYAIIVPAVDQWVFYPQGIVEPKFPDLTIQQMHRGTSLPIIGTFH